MYHARDLFNVTWNISFTYTRATLHGAFTHADERSLEKGSHRFHALCAKVNRRGKRKLPVILTGTEVQPPTTKKLENPRSAAARLDEARSRGKRSNGTAGSYRRSFTRMHNYLVSWRTSSTVVSIAALSRLFLHPRRASAFLWLMKAHLSRENDAYNVSLASFTQDKCSPRRRIGRTAMICRSHYAEKKRWLVGKTASQVTVWSMSLGGFRESYEEEVVFRGNLSIRLYEYPSV